MTLLRSVPSPDAPDPVGGRAAPAVRRRGAGPSTTRRGPPPQPPRGRRADLRRDARGRPRRRRRTPRSRRPGGRRSTRPRCSTASASCSTRSGSRCCWATARGSSRSSTRWVAATPRDPLGPGALLIGDPSDVVLNEGRESVELAVTSRSRRRIRISSHYPFDRVNPRLEFDRAAARGFHLDLAAGAWTGWEPGETKTVRLVRYAGAAGHGAMTRLSAEEYRARYGPTTGDRVRLGDTDLWIRVGGGPHGPRRRAGLGLREEPAQPDRAVGRGVRTVGARRRPHRRARRRPGHRRRQGRHRHQGRPDRRASAGPGAPRSATASTSSSAPTRSRSWPTG